jgi:hypothetical protein
MSAPPDVIGRLLVADLDQVYDVLADDKSSAELYRALANVRWSKGDGPDGFVVLSFKSAEEVVNDLRGRRGMAPLALAQTGREGEVSDTVRALLVDRLGWSFTPEDTGEHDPAHVWSPEDEHRTEPNRPWEEQAHAEADEALRERGVIPIDRGR